MKRGDTFPPLKLTVEDASGLVDLTTATGIRVLIKSDSNLIELVGVPIDPPEDETENGVTVQRNLQADFSAGDTDIVDTYKIEVEVTWAVGEIETFPSAAADNPTLVIDQDNG
jgi:hypothetical protein